MPNVDFNAYDKLNAAFQYAQQVKNDPTARGGDSVVRLQGGDAITCSYSTADAPRGLFNRASRHQDQTDLNNATRAIFKQAVIDVFGTTIDDVPKSVRTAMELDRFNNSGKPLTARRILAVNKAINAELKAFAKQFGITGAAASEIVSIVADGSGLEKAADPAGAFKTRVSRHAKANVAMLIAGQMSGATSYDSFSADIKRGMTVSLGGKKVKTRDPDAARDKIVQFLTGDKRATFDAAGEATKRKASVLMSVLHQGAFGSAMTSMGHAFDPEAKSPIFQAGEGVNMGGDQTNGFSVTKDADGNITIKGTTKFTRHFSVVAANGRKMLNNATDDDGSYAKYEVEIKIPASDMDKFAGADWSQCDMAESTRLEQNYRIADRFHQAADKIGASFKFTGTVDASMKIHVNALYDQQTIYERTNPNQVPA
ncbi:MAG: hypothetical protein IJI73_11095 [Kiritimatiellae bacterium]|nr:hypothetical protein [Kiritimatiellia bacterium]